MVQFPWVNPVKSPPPLPLSLGKNPRSRGEEVQAAEVRRYKSARVRENIKTGEDTKSSPQGVHSHVRPKQNGPGPILSLVSPLMSQDGESFKGKKQHFARNILGQQGCYKKGCKTQQRQIHL